MLAPDLNVENPVAPVEHGSLFMQDDSHVANADDSASNMDNVERLENDEVNIPF